MSTGETSFEVVRAGAPVAPEKPGRRATGEVFAGGEAAEMGARPAAEPEECELRVLKRQAVGICMQWLGSPDAVKAREEGGYCFLRVKVGAEWGEVKATTWWACLRAVQAHLQRRGLIELPDGTPPYQGIPFTVDPADEYRASEEPEEPEEDLRS